MNRQREVFESRHQYGLRKHLISGNKYATVFPEPVCATTCKSHQKAMGSINSLQHFFTIPNTFRQSLANESVERRRCSGNILKWILTEVQHEMEKKMLHLLSMLNNQKSRKSRVESLYSRVKCQRSDEDRWFTSICVQSLHLTAWKWRSCFKWKFLSFIYFYAVFTAYLVSNFAILPVNVCSLMLFEFAAFGEYIKVVYPSSPALSARR